MVDLGIAIFPLWIVALAIAVGSRSLLAALCLVPFVTVSAVAWGQLLPRFSAGHLAFPWLVWLTVLGLTVLVAGPRLSLLRHRRLAASGVTVFALMIALVIAWIPTPVLIQVLGWGHDNSAHIFLMGANDYCGGLLFACASNLPVVPQYLVEYPQGFAVSWASLPGTLETSDPVSALRVYAALYLICSLALVVMVGMFAATLARTSNLRWLAGVLAALTVVFGVWSHQFWSGFASFLWTTLIVICFVVLREAKILAPNWQWIPIALCSLVATTYSHQLLLPFLLVYILVDGFRSRQHLIISVGLRPLIILPIVVFGLALLVSAPRSAQGNSFTDQIVVEAGMEVIPVWVWIPLAVVGGFVLFAHGEANRVALRWATLLSGALFGGLALLTIRANGYVSYYPMKLLTFLTLILIACSAAASVHKPIDTRARQAWFTLSGLVVLSLAILPPFLRYPGFKTAYQGSTTTVIRTLAQDPFGGGVALCAPFVLDAIDRLPSDVGRVEVYRGGELQPLEGRWINQLRGHWDTTAWMNEVDWRPMEEIPANQEPDMIISHDSAGVTPAGIPRLVLGEPCDRQPLPPVLPIG